MAEKSNAEFMKESRKRNNTDKKLINDVALSMASKTALRVIAVEALGRESEACERLQQADKRYEDITGGMMKKQVKLTQELANYDGKIEQQQTCIRELKVAYELSDIPKCSCCDSLHGADKRKAALIAKAEEMLKPGE